MHAIMSEILIEPVRGTFIRGSTITPTKAHVKRFSNVRMCKRQLSLAVPERWYQFRFYGRFPEPVILCSIV